MIYVAIVWRQLIHREMLPRTSSSSRGSFLEASTELADQLPRHLVSVGRTLVPQDLALDSVSDPPIERSDAHVYRYRGLPASMFDWLRVSFNRFRELTGFSSALEVGDFVRPLITGQQPTKLSDFIDLHKAEFAY